MLRERIKRKAHEVVYSAGTRDPIKICEAKNISVYYAFIKTLISQWIKNEKDSSDYVSIKKTLMEIQSIYDRGH